MEIILKKEYSKIINFWLLSLLFFIGVIVIVGGLTRLTDSGLSITTWDIVKGILPPLNNNQWEEDNVICPPRFYCFWDKKPFNVSADGVVTECVRALPEMKAMVNAPDEPGVKGVEPWTARRTNEHSAMEEAMRPGE